MRQNVINEISTRIRNAIRAHHTRVEVPKTQITCALASILKREHLIEDVSESVYSIEKNKGKSILLIQLKYRGIQNAPVISNIQIVSRQSMRIYTSYKDIPQVLGGFGLIVLSTPQGLLTDREARHYNLGGEVLCSIWSN
jgi:small subunit ribosomal protein S8